MKLRTDYVTNSSSSSFIIRDIDMDKFIGLLPQKKQEIIKKFGYLIEEEKFPGWCKLLDKEFDEIEIKRFREHDLYDLWELYDWYKDRGKLKEMLGISKKDKNDEWINRKLSDQVIEHITVWVILEYMNKAYRADEDYALSFDYSVWYGRHTDWESNYSYFSWIEAELLKTAVMNNYADVEDCMKKFEGMHIGDLM